MAGPRSWRREGRLTAQESPIRHTRRRRRPWMEATRWSREQLRAPPILMCRRGCPRKGARGPQSATGQHH